ncbi:hypothetical protein ABW19_dt0204223 [Dactylella cylindrospora]|nr:hypothetical protein ABW19_dt0204223 [Dactylella cylindrospora]
MEKKEMASNDTSPRNDTKEMDTNVLEFTFPSILDQRSADPQVEKGEKERRDLKDTCTNSDKEPDQETLVEETNTITTPEPSTDKAAEPQTSILKPSTPETKKTPRSASKGKRVKFAEQPDHEKPKKEPKELESALTRLPLGSPARRAVRSGNCYLTPSYVVETSQNKLKLDELERSMVTVGIQITALQARLQLAERRWGEACIRMEKLEKVIEGLKEAKEENEEEEVEEAQPWCDKILLFVWGLLLLSFKTMAGIYVFYILTIAYANLIGN